jgi:hypothetical protein
MEGETIIQRISQDRAYRARRTYIEHRGVNFFVSHITGHIMQNVRTLQQIDTSTSQELEHISVKTTLYYFLAGKSISHNFPWLKI